MYFVERSIIVFLSQRVDCMFMKCFVVFLLFNTCVVLAGIPPGVLYTSLYYDNDIHVLLYTHHTTYPLTTTRSIPHTGHHSLHECTDRGSIGI